MDRPEQDANRKFGGGVFSGTIPEETRTEQDLQEDCYFDNASGQAEKPQGSSREQRMGEEGVSNGGEGALGEMRQERAYQERIYPNHGTYRNDAPYQGCGYNDKYGESMQYGSRMGVGMPPYPYSNNDRCKSCQYKHYPDGRTTDATVRTVLILSWVAIAALTIAFLATVFCLVKVSSRQSVRQGVAMDNGGKSSYIEENPSKGLPEGWYGENPMPEIMGDGGDYYGEIADAIRTDLEYSIQWENYEYEGSSDKVRIAVDYPVIKGDVPNLDAINGIIADETEYFEEYYEEYSRYMMPEERFLVYSEGYVTFMDAEVMSVVFCEMIYTDYWADYGLYCLNIDMENGVVLDNGSIIEIDDEFAVDFRKRCRQQNGPVSGLDNMTDQEIAYYLTSGGTAILFYTPMGMEVGLNFGEYYVTVTYKDYEKFLQKY